MIKYHQAAKVAVVARNVNTTQIHTHLETTLSVLGLSDGLPDPVVEGLLDLETS
jgi:hypothetical protein